jgi:hypothetical protein
MEGLTAQHCLTIAAAFIAIIAACATLISGAHNKAESISNSIRDSTKEYRENNDRERCSQIQEQLKLLREIILRVQRAQRLLFSTIAAFISSLAVFIGLGLYLTYFNVPTERMHLISRPWIIVIGIFVAAGTISMLKAVYLQFRVLGESYKTLRVEMRDCESPDAMEPSKKVAQDLSHVT